MLLWLKYAVATNLVMQAKFRSFLDLKWSLNNASAAYCAEYLHLSSLRMPVNISLIVCLVWVIVRHNIVLLSLTRRVHHSGDGS